jgi:hypothetical protein
MPCRGATKHDCEVSSEHIVEHFFFVFFFFAV